VISGLIQLDSPGVILIGRTRWPQGRLFRCYNFAHGADAEDLKSRLRKTSESGPCFKIVGDRVLRVWGAFSRYSWTSCRILDVVKGEMSLSARPHPWIFRRHEIEHCAVLRNSGITGCGDTARKIIFSGMDLDREYIRTGVWGGMQSWRTVLA